MYFKMPGKIVLEDPKWVPQQGEKRADKAQVKVKFSRGSSVFEQGVYMYIPKNKPLTVIERPWSIGGNSGTTYYVLVPCLKGDKLVNGQWYCANMSSSATPIKKEGRNGKADVDESRLLWEGDGADLLREALDDSITVDNDTAVYDFETLQKNYGGKFFLFKEVDKKVKCLGFKDGQISDEYADYRECNFYELEIAEPDTDLIKAVKEWDK